MTVDIVRTAPAPRSEDPIAQIVVTDAYGDKLKFDAKRSRSRLYALAREQVSLKVADVAALRDALTAWLENAEA